MGTEQRPLLFYGVGDDGDAFFDLFFVGVAVGEAEGVVLCAFGVEGFADDEDGALVDGAFEDGAGVDVLGEGEPDVESSAGAVPLDVGWEGALEQVAHGFGAAAVFVADAFDVGLEHAAADELVGDDLGEAW